eukprot:504887_1
MCGRTSCSDACLECLDRLVRPESNSSVDHRRPRTNRPYTSCNFSPSHAAPVAYRGLIRKHQAVEGKRDSSGSASDDVDESLRIQLMTWGLVPSYTKSTTSVAPNHFRMFNARSETVSSLPTFSRLISKRRCITAVDGFYEWYTFDCGPGVRKKKQPYFVYRKDGQPLLLACLYDTWRREKCRENECTIRPTISVKQQKEEDENGPVLFTYTILTTDTEGTALQWLHNRMPLMLGQEMAKTWLTCGDDGIAAVDALKAAPFDVDRKLCWHPVTERMGSTKYQDTDCSRDISTELRKAASSPITKYFSPKKADGRSGDNPVKLATRLNFNNNTKCAAAAVDSPGTKAAQDIKVKVEVKPNIKIHLRQSGDTMSGQSRKFSQKRKYMAPLKKSPLNCKGGKKQTQLGAFFSPSKQA